MSTAALIVAAGRGSRASSPGSPPKQYSLLNGVSILRRTVLAFLNHPRISSVTVVIHADDDDLYMAAMKGLPAKLTMPLAAGTTRHDPVPTGRAGLVALDFTRRREALWLEIGVPLSENTRGVSAQDAPSRKEGPRQTR